VKKRKKILLLGSSHDRKIGPMLQENLGTKFDMCSIFKPNAPLAKVVEDIRKLGKGPTKAKSYYYSGRARNSLRKAIIIQLKMISTSL
jgi:hypothetical protein